MPLRDIIDSINALTCLVININTLLLILRQKNSRNN